MLYARAGGEGKEGEEKGEWEWKGEEEGEKEQGMKGEEEKLVGMVKGIEAEGEKWMMEEKKINEK